jgi:ATP-dependent RNA helicase HelY
MQAPSAERELSPLAAEFAAHLPFAPDRFQVEALSAVEGGESVLVCAPTGSGKTVVAEFACWLALREGAKCFYTTPLKALSNQKFGDLIAHHGAKPVGLLTGDNTINGEASLVVMTTEVLRNMLYEGSDTLRGLRWVVLDEVHYLQDPYRGAVWEEVLIHLPPEVRVVSLSATVSNSEEFGDWLSTLRGRTHVIVEQRRPVELRNMVMVGEDVQPLFVSADGRRELNPEVVRSWARGAAMAAKIGFRAGERRRRRPGDSVYMPTRIEVAEALADKRMLPAIVFIFSRVGCDKAVEACLFAEVDLTTAQEADRIQEFAEMRAATLEQDDLRALGYGMFVEALKRGVAAHHAGMIPVFKETVEELFAMGLVKLVFATETLSLGINMPAKTVVIERLTKFNGERHELLTPMDYTQLTGRAGRRGIDSLGYAVVLYNPWLPLERVASLATVKAYPLTSSFRPSYNMAVNLVRNYDPETAAHLLNSSFAQFVADRDVVKLERLVEDREREVAAMRDKAECELGDALEYARLRADALAASRARRGGELVQKAFARLTPGDVIVGGRLGRAVVLEQPRSGGSGPQLTVMTQDRKLRKVTPRDFELPPDPVAKLPVPKRGHAQRSSAVRRDLLRGLQELDVPRAERAPSLAEISDLERAWREHPVHLCPDADDHVRWAEKLARAQSEATAARRRVRRRRDTIARTFERVLNVLRRLGYVTDQGDQGETAPRSKWGLTPKGETLTRVYNEADLLVVECLDRSWFAGLDADELAATASLFVYEPRGREEPRGSPTPHLSRYQRRIANLFRSLHEVEQKENLELVKEPDAGFMSAIYEWARGSSLEDVLEEQEMSAGDFVRSAKQVVDLLQQLRQVVGAGELAETLREAVAAVQRGVVAYSSVV